MSLDKFLTGKNKKSQKKNENKNISKINDKTNDDRNKITEEKALKTDEINKQTHISPKQTIKNKTTTKDLVLNKSTSKASVDNKTLLLKNLLEKIEAMDKTALVNDIIEMVHSSPLYVTHKNMIGSIIELENGLENIDNFTASEIAFELDLNEFYIEILLREIRIEWKSR